MVGQLQQRDRPGQSRIQKVQDPFLLQVTGQQKAFITLIALVQIDYQG